LETSPNFIEVQANLIDNSNINVFCGAFIDLKVNQSGPFTVDDIISQSFVSKAASKRAVIKISNLIPSTRYRIYCVAVSYGGIVSSFADALTSMTNANTACCKKVTVSLNSPDAVVGQTFDNAITVTVDYQPLFDLSVSLATTSVTNTSQSVQGKLLLVPAISQVFETRVRGSTISTALLRGESRTYSIVLSSLSEDQYRISANLQGRSEQEFQVQYQSFGNTPSQLVLSVKSPLQLIPKQQRVTAPRAVSAMFSDDGSVVQIQFDRDTNRGGYVNGFDCNRVLQFRGDQRAVCRWISNSVIQIGFSESSKSSSILFLLAINDTVILRNDTNIRFPCQQTENVTTTATTLQCRLANSSIGTSLIVQRPTNPLGPIVILSVPTQIAPCSLLRLDVSGSVGSGGRDWQSYRFVVRNSRAFGMEFLEEFLHSSSYSLVPATPIPSSFLLPDSVYSIELTLCNFLSACGTSTVTVRVTNLTTPAFALFLLGMPQVTIFPKGVLRIQTQPLVTVCNDSSGDSQAVATNSVYNWQVTLVNGSVLSTVRSKSLDPLTFYLPSFSLQPEKEYIIKGAATTSTARFTTLSSQTSVRVTVANDVLVANVDGNVAKTLLVGQSMRLDASGSTDNNFPKGQSGIAAGLHILWSCYQLYPVAVDSSSCPLLLSGWRTGSMTSSAAVTAFDSGKSEFANVTAIALNSISNVTTRVVVTVSSGSRTASTFIDILVVSSPVRSNVITMKLLQEGDNRMFNVQQKLSILGTIDLYKSCNASWSVDDPTISLRQISLTPLQTMLQVASATTSTERLYLSLSPNSLPGDSSFTFRLKCDHSFESIRVDTNSPPRPGAFLATPGKGNALTTSFQLLALRWTDQQVPLLYEFRYWAYTTQSYVTLRSFQPVNELTTVLPLGSESNAFQVPLQLSVSDTFNAVTQASSNVSVQGVVNVTQSVRFAAEIVKALDPSDVETTKQQLSVLGMVMLQANCTQVVRSCGSWNREPCTTISQTCGNCLAGYVGEVGSANSPCTLAASSSSRDMSNSQFITQYVDRLGRKGTSRGSRKQNFDIPDVSSSKFAKKNARAEFDPVSRRYLQSSNDSSNGVSKVSCRVTSDCQLAAGIDSPWIYCNRRLRLCAVRSKVCPGSCSSQGACVFRDLNNGASLQDCSTGDPQCEAVCQCNEGYFGESCDISPPNWGALRHFTSQAISALYSTSLIEVMSLQSVSVRTQLLTSLTFKSDRLDRGDIQRVLLLVGDILTYFEKLQDEATLALPASVSGRQVDAAAALTSSDLTTLQQLLEVLDHLASPSLLWDETMNSMWNATSWSDLSPAMLAPSLNNTLVQSRGLLTLVQRQQNIVRRYQVVGEDSSLVILRNLRVTLHAVQTQREGGSTNVSSPISPDEALADVLDPFGFRPARHLQTTMEFVWRTALDSTLPPSDADALLNVSTADIVISLVELRARQYQNHRVLHNNPVFLQMNFVSSPQEMLSFLLPSLESSRNLRNVVLEDVRAALAESVEAVRWNIPHIHQVVAYTNDFVVRNLTSICYGPNDVSFYEMQCEDSGVFLRHNCSERRGRLVSFCPKAISSCSHLSSVISYPFDVSFANESLEETSLEQYSSMDPLCQLRSYSEYGTVCHCDIESGLTANRSAQSNLEEYYYVYGIKDGTEPRTPAEFLLARDRSLEITVVNSYEPYRFADYFEETRINPQFPVPWATLALFAPVYLLFLLFGVSWQRFRRQRVVAKQSKEIAKGNKIAIQLNVEAGSYYAGEAAKGDSKTTDDVFEDYLSLISSLAPEFSVSNSGRVWQQAQSMATAIWKHNRYLALLQEILQIRDWIWSIDDDSFDELNDVDIATVRGLSKATSSSSFPEASSHTSTSIRFVRGIWRRTKLLLSLFLASLCSITVVIVLLDAQFYMRSSLCQAQTPQISRYSFVVEQAGNYSSAQIPQELAIVLERAEQKCRRIHSLLDDGVARCNWRIFPDTFHVLRPTELQPLTLHFECEAVFDSSLFSLFALAQVGILALFALWTIGTTVRYILCWFDRRFISFWLRRDGIASSALAKLYVAIPMSGKVRHLIEGLHESMQQRFSAVPLQRVVRLMSNGQRSNGQLLNVLVSDNMLVSRVATVVSFLIKINAGFGTRQQLGLTELHRLELVGVAEDFCRRWDRLLKSPTVHLLHRLARKSKISDGDGSKVVLSGNQFQYLAEGIAQQLRKRIAQETRSAVFLRSFFTNHRKGSAERASSASMIAIRALYVALMRDILGGDDSVVTNVWLWHFRRSHPSSIVSKEAQRVAQQAKNPTSLRQLQVAVIFLVTLLALCLTGIVTVFLRKEYRDYQILSFVSTRMVVVFFSILAADIVLLCPLQIVALHCWMPAIVSPAIVDGQQRLQRMIAVLLQRLLLLRDGDIKEAEKSIYDIPMRSTLSCGALLSPGRSLLSSQHLLRMGFCDRDGKLRIGTANTAVQHHFGKFVNEGRNSIVGIGPGPGPGNRLSVHDNLPGYDGIVGVTALLASCCTEALVLQPPCALELLRTPDEEAHRADLDDDLDVVQLTAWQEHAANIADRGRPLASEIPTPGEPDSGDAQERGQSREHKKRTQLRSAELDLQTAARNAVAAIEDSSINNRSASLETASEQGDGAAARRRRRPSFLLTWRKGAQMDNDSDDAASEEFATVRPDGAGAISRCSSVLAACWAARKRNILRVIGILRTFRTVMHRNSLRFLNVLLTTGIADMEGGSEGFVECFWFVGFVLLLEVVVCALLPAWTTSVRMVCFIAAGLFMLWLVVLALCMLLVVYRWEFWKQRLLNIPTADARRNLRRRRFGHIERRVLGGIDRVPIKHALLSLNSEQLRHIEKLDDDSDDEEDAATGPVWRTKETESHWAEVQLAALQTRFQAYCNQAGLDTSWNQGEKSDQHLSELQHLQNHFAQPLEEVDEEEDYSDSDDDSSDEDDEEEEQVSPRNDPASLLSSSSSDSYSDSDIDDDAVVQHLHMPVQFPPSPRNVMIQVKSHHSYTDASHDSQESKLNHSSELSAPPQQPPTSRMPLMPRLPSLSTNGLNRVVPVGMSSTSTAPPPTFPSVVPTIPLSPIGSLASKKRIVPFSHDPLANDVFVVQATIGISSTEISVADNARERIVQGEANLTGSPSPSSRSDKINASNRPEPAMIPPLSEAPVPTALDQVEQGSGNSQPSLSVDAAPIVDRESTLSHDSDTKLDSRQRRRQHSGQGSNEKSERMEFGKPSPVAALSHISPDQIATYMDPVVDPVFSMKYSNSRSDVPEAVMSASISQKIRRTNSQNREKSVDDSIVLAPIIPGSSAPSNPIEDQIANRSNSQFKNESSTVQLPTLLVPLADLISSSSKFPSVPAAAVLPSIPPLSLSFTSTLPSLMDVGNFSSPLVTKKVLTSASESRSTRLPLRSGSPSTEFIQRSVENRSDDSSMNDEDDDEDEYNSDQSSSAGDAMSASDEDDNSSEDTNES
jgi:hypothetical protein